MNKITYTITGLVLAMMMSCASDNKPESDELSDKKIAEELAAEDDGADAQKVFYALPSPFELSSLLKASGVEFEEGILNSVDNLSKYNSTTSKAVNLGIYGADVSITSIYDKTQHTMRYLACIKKLGDDLGISNAFDSKTMERLESSKESQDSLQNIVAEAYSLANNYLKENARSSSASLILTGGWIEGVHIATSMLDMNDPNEDLIELIADQRFSIENLILLLELNQSEPDVAAILKDLNELNTLFQEISSESDTQVSTTKTNGKTVFGGGGSPSINPELLKKIIAKITAIRNSLIG